MLRFTSCTKNVNLCVENQASKCKPRVEVHPGQLFDKFFPGKSLSCDFGVYNGVNIIVVCDLQAYHCCNQNTEEVVAETVFGSNMD